MQYSNRCIPNNNKEIKFLLETNLVLILTSCRKGQKKYVPSKESR